MLTRTVAMLGTVAALLGLAALGTTANAQTSGAQSPSQSGTSQPDQQKGTTSGPASDSPATLGTSGTVPATPHQTQDIRDPGPAVTRELEQGSQPDATQSSGSVGTKQPGSPGTESGLPPK